MTIPFCAAPPIYNIKKKFNSIPFRIRRVSCQKSRFTRILESKSYKNNSKALQNLKDEARIKEQFITLEFFILNGKYFFGSMYI
jgi:hypothetical protein